MEKPGRKTNPVYPPEKHPMADASTTPFYELRDAFIHDLAKAESMIAADRGLLNARNSLGETVLHWLAIENALAEVRLLIRLGADVNCINESGRTPLMEIAMLGLEDMCRLLLEHGANVRHVSDEGESALSHAALSKRKHLLHLLLAQFPAGESLQPYFDEMDLEMLLMKDNEVSKLLQSRGLTVTPSDWP